MQKLYEAVREECSPTVWKRAQQLTRKGKVNGKRTHNDEVEVRWITDGGMVSPLVVLSPKHQDWSCECNSDETACIHVAAAVISLKDTLKDGGEVPGLKVPTAKLAYRFTRKNGALELTRFLMRGKKPTPLELRLTEARRKDSQEDISASQADIEVDLALGNVVRGKIPRMIMERALTAMAGCEDVMLDGVKVRIGAPRPVIHIRVDDDEDGFRVYAEQDSSISEIFNNGAVLQGKSLRPIGEMKLSGRDLEELRQGRVYPFGAVADLVGRVIPALEERMPVQIRSKVLPDAKPMLPNLSFQVEHDGTALNVLPTLVYGDPPSARVDSGKLHYLGGKLPLRNERAEKRLTAELRDRLDMAVGRMEHFGGMAALRIAETLRDWDAAQVEGDGLEACFVAEPLEPSFDLSEASSDLSFKTVVAGKELRADASAVVRAWQRGETLVPLSDGGWAPLPADVMQRCGHLIADLVAARGDDNVLPRSALPDLARLCEALDQPPPPALQRLRELLGDYEGIADAPLPSDLTAELRDYQVHGVNWLSFVSSVDMGAMLADDMGLGKTLQALCVIKRPTLVVAPASVLHNWQAEVKRFRPSLKINIYHGPNRGLDETADVTLTTYAILRGDTELLAEVKWDAVVLDEAQNIKNSDSQVARAAFELQARFRMTLSGTPVENRLEELWSQFHFINRGLLGGRKDFQERYARPISEGDEGALLRLRARIKPFMLRRLKKDVASELPPRTDVVLRCTLDERERDLYDSVRAATRKEILQELSTGGSVLAALEALLRLRQACCHTSLLPGQSAEGSAKLRLLMETLDEAVAEGHKAIVFSQWTSLLDLTEPELRKAGMDFTRLDGSTRDRGAVVNLFQSDDGPPVMLVSLRAGGTGLNLTAADNVFLLDPWWNPAVEDQAADRAHRIGQERPVLVQRLVATDTVEERMLALQARKRSLAEAATGGAGQVGGLTRDDLLSLLS